MAESILQMIIALVVGMISARFLGPSDYGLINYGAAYMNIFGMIAKLGIDSIIVKEFVNRPKDAGELIGTTMLLRSISSVISIGMIWITIEVLKGHQVLLITVTLLQALSICFQGIDIIALWYQSRLESKNVSIARSIAHIGVAVYKIVLLVLGKDVRWFAFAVTFEYIVLLFVLLGIYIKKRGPRWSVSVSTAKTLLYAGFPFIWSGLISVIYTQMDKLMLGHFLGEAEVGLYAAGATVGELWGFIPSAIIASMTPVITEEKQRDENVYQEKLILLFSIVLWIGVVISASITPLSRVIMMILYGKDFVDASTVLFIIAWSSIFAYLGVARGVFLVNENLNRYSVVFIAIGGVINLFLNYILIQILGMEGAAVATLITQGTVTIICPFFFSKTKVLVKYYLEAISPGRIINLIWEEKRNN